MRTEAARAETADGVDLRDAGVVEAAERLRLLLEAPQDLGTRDFGAQDLQRDAATRLVLLGLEHRADPARAEATEDPVVVDALGYPGLALVHAGWPPPLDPRCGGGTSGALGALEPCNTFAARAARRTT